MAPRRPFVGGNWKMHADLASAQALARDVAQGLGDAAAALDAAVFPAFVHLAAVAGALKGSGVILGGQDAYPEPKGAFTGEVSCPMLDDAGCAAVLAGHSERRHVIGETDELVAAKARAALAHPLTCVLCIGETLDQREAGQTDAVNERQLRSALRRQDAPLIANLVIAYEPVWAIGTGRTASPADAQAAHAHIRAVLADIYAAETAQRTRIIYGGSVKADNAAELFAQPDIDGALVGGASLDPKAFIAICRAALATLGAAEGSAA